MAMPHDLPAHDKLADLLDTDDWDTAQHGRMVDFADDGDTIPVETHITAAPADGGADPSRT